MKLSDKENKINVDIPVLKSTMGADVLDIRGLYNSTGMFTYDPGFTSTAACDSAITYINGYKGKLLHHGYRIEDLVENCDFLEVIYLLLYGNLPKKEKLAEFDTIITRRSMVHEQMMHFFRGFRRDAHPMAIMVGVVGALSSFYHDSTDINDPKQRELASLRIISKMPTIAAMAYKYSIGQPFVYPKNSLSFAENLLHMTFSVPAEDYEIKPEAAAAIDKILILHADHEQNASTSTVRIAGSSGANPFACIAAGISCLWGPAHGGANEAVLVMLNEIGDRSNIQEYINKAKDKNDPFRLMGFGHRVYKNHDPRATVLKKYADDVLNALNINDPLLDLAKELEEIALSDSYFIDRKLFPNVDFYSGIILKALGFPTSMFTVLFAISRTVGWVAQWNEMIADPLQKIGRPRQLYKGPEEQNFIKMKDR